MHFHAEYLGKFKHACKLGMTLKISLYIFPKSKL